MESRFRVRFGTALLIVATMLPWLSGGAAAQSTAGGGSVEALGGLAPNDPIAAVARWLRERSEDQSVALVGHLPFLDRLASSLVVDDEDAKVISFQMGGLVKLVPTPDDDGFAVAWVLVPDIA